MIKYPVYYYRYPDFPKNLKMIGNRVEGEEFWFLSSSQYSDAYSVVVGVLSNNKVTSIYFYPCNKRLIELFDDQLYRHIIYGTGIISISGPCIVYKRGWYSKFDNVQQIMNQIFKN